MLPAVPGGEAERPRGAPPPTPLTSGSRGGGEHLPGLGGAPAAEELRRLRLRRAPGSGEAWLQRMASAAEGGASATARLGEVGGESSESNEKQPFAPASAGFTCATSQARSPRPKLGAAS